MLKLTKPSGGSRMEEPQSRLAGLKKARGKSMSQSKGLKKPLLATIINTENLKNSTNQTIRTLLRCKNRLEERLEEKKKLAQSEDEKEQASAILIIDGHCFEVLDRGKGMYGFVLVDNWYYLQISGSKRQKLPQVYVQVSSELLTCYGLDKAINDLRKTVYMLLEKIEDETISRADIFVDFVTDRGGSHELVRHRLASYCQESTR